MKNMMLLAMAAGATALSTAASGSVILAPITYTGSQQIGTILASYSITTNGKTGMLSFADVTGFDVTLSDTISSVEFSRSPSAGTGSVSGDLVATATTLKIPSFDSFGLYSNGTGPSGGYLGTLTFSFLQTSAQIDDAAHGNGLALSTPASNTSTAIATATATAAVPEPATWSMMILGVGAIGTALRRQRARTAVRFA